MQSAKLRSDVICWQWIEFPHGDEHMKEYSGRTKGWYCTMCNSYVPLLLWHNEINNVLHLTRTKYRWVRIFEWCLRVLPVWCDGVCVFLRRDDYTYGTRSFYYNDRKLSILFQRISQDIVNIINLELNLKSLATKEVKKVILYAISLFWMSF